MASIKLILRKDKVNKNTGVAPLYLRIIKNRKAKFVSLGLKLLLTDWNELTQKVRKTHKNSARMNAFLASKIAEAENLMLKETGKNKNVTPNELKIAVMGKEPAKFFEYTYKKLETLKPVISYNSFENYIGNIRKFERFTKNKNLYFEDISVSYLKDYENHLFSELNNGQTTAEFAFRVIKLMFNHAIREEYIDMTLYPFRKFKIKKGKSTKSYLTESQFKVFINYQPKTAEQTSRDTFLFSCYAGGLRFFDVLEIKWENYIEEDRRIEKVIHKTGRKHNFRLPDQAIEILEKYKNPENKGTDFIFPLLENNVDYSDGRVMYNAKNNHNRRINKNLRKIGKELNFPFCLTFHISRHTFATLVLKNGMRIEYVSKILDHSDIQITQVYAKIINKELDDAMDNAFG